MNRDELKKILDVKKVPHMSYSLDGLKNGMSLCIVPENNKWKLIYVERSSKNYIGEYNSEHDVCDAFYQIMKDDYGWKD
ncbi:MULTISPECIES: hypothetical protein [unclassified Gilliamella]|uniref:hypothetical protein n=1 Tax=unclassified Gilliamella TaxID=2685620 RepID=UPI00226AFD5C|nr:MULTISPECIES: hypothetical protein [unclassified Gilliamella]MCX8575539.1 hypothetical protein [Gilliamella sp. B3831]MCX8577770.1 hypothetical protein [Gilliamella sp. B3815]MCX8590629.1 hypothetical protein [Gilliamella sp. B3812]MCX8604884.1 hypothetical protein [Gilliamella sp. B3823]MCX8606189.1 hypothetical protein [Gilliamella sp. B3825]